MSAYGWSGSLPDRISFGLESVYIERVAPDVEGALGCLDTSVRPWRLLVHPDLPAVGAHVILLHELLHAVDEALQGAGVVQAPLPEEWITNAAPILLHSLASAGLWGGLSAADVEEFMRVEGAAHDLARERGDEG